MSKWKALFAGCLFALPLLPQAQSEDPDLPPNSNGRLDKEQYLLQRQKYFLDRRTSAIQLSVNPRLLAIEQMKQMEAQQLNNPNVLLSFPNWAQLGPSPIPNGQTTTFSVAVSGRSTAIAIHPTNPNIVYIGTANGGVYRSMNGGTTWTSIFDNGQSLAIGALALAPSNPSTLYIGTGEPNLSVDSYMGVGLYRIDNADATPTLVGPINPDFTFNNGSTNITTGTFTYRTISKIIVHPTDPATIFVATSTGTTSNPASNPPNVLPPTALVGLYRSTNATAAANAVTFTKLAVTDGGSVDVPGTGNRRITDIVFEPGNTNNILAWVFDAVNNGSLTQGCGIYRTTNALMATPAFTKVYNSATSNVRGTFGISKVGLNVIVFAATGEGAAGKIIRSDDAGNTWNTSSGTFGYCSTQCFYDIAIAVDPTDFKKVYIGGAAGGNIFKRSVDSAQTFTSITTNLHADVHDVEIAPSNTSVIYLACDGGVFKSTDGASTWSSINTAGFHATQFQSIALHPTDPNFTIGGTQDNGTIMMKPDGTFTRIDGGDGGYALIDQNAPDNTNVVMYHTYFNASSQSGFARTDVVGGTFNFYGCGGIANGIACPGQVLFYAPMAMGPGSPNIVYYGNEILYRSTNKGVAETAVSQNFASAISTISISPQDDNYRIIGMNNGKVYATISGANPLVDITPPSAPAKPAGRVFINPANKNTAYVTFVGYGVTAGQHIWKTTNLNDLGGTGVIWTAAGNGLPDVPVNSFTMSGSNQNILFAGTDIGVFVSTDAGNNWNTFSAGLPIVPVFDMAIHPVTKNLRIATHGRGLWESTNNPLPVTFTDFKLNVKGTMVFLQWYTANETNNRGFEIQRALETNGNSGLKWEKIGFVNGSGTTTSPRRYAFDDVPVGGKKFVYRIRQINFDNQSKFTDIKEAILSNFDFALFPVFPNPARRSAIVKYQLPANEPTTLALYNSAGMLIKYLFHEMKESGIYQYNFNTEGLPAGAYYLSLKTPTYFNSKPFVIIGQ